MSHAHRIDPFGATRVRFHFSHSGRIPTIIVSSCCRQRACRYLGARAAFVDSSYRENLVSLRDACSVTFRTAERMLINSAQRLSEFPSVLMDIYMFALR